MIHTYEEAIGWIHSRLKFGIKPGLERMRWMLEELGNPERHIKCVHLAGTNGKGSTLTYMRYMLEDAKYKVGTFTSPYIETFNERISVNGTPIADEEITELVKMVKPIVEKLDETDLGEATEFEIITVMAICYFGKVNFCDVVLFETGLGGRFDSTNVIHPVLTIITNIGHDHMHILGNTLGEIAYEKAGIIKSGVPVITGVQDEEALQVIQKVAKEKHANVYEMDNHFTALHKQSSEDGEQFDFTCPFASFEDVRISMKGSHQVGNAALALMAIIYVKTYLSFLIEEEEIRTGLQEAYWIGRFEKLKSNPDVIIDGAHNPEGIESLVKTVESHYKGKNVIVLFTALGDKELHNMVGQLETIADEIIFTTFAFDRAISADKLASYSKKESKLVFENWKEAIDTKIEMIGENDVFIITGSLYFISEVRKYIREKN
ncbi:bifunctional tetrahydrofolate synthase/dihydrofolate synthase [Bacillus sp. MHSD_36]|uniref:bifunctional folylpolyglutamate synthase/dihydrofolate synthase n=1 Tax=unclassified Bacillus (in: firmicutes) TaxID=185979 RepID=UPI0027422DB8|nr:MULTISPECIES: bifunctional tetrahydrofolate synthase/dihydrofolate synthase [unclassified Bacillus (in: firmicutes)]MDP7990399.1 bifunctional tetrahydrofolate synthase/dihydrofolate synthase [Bacillus sp. MHSD_36]MDR4978826.1 bifunctional tetrahydrofolate synthase/dihydrofolate synthase [Bacillus sp. MHSD_37]